MKKISASSNKAASPRAQVRRYLASLPAGTRRELKKLREAIRAAAPEAEESFSYGIPAFKIDGRPFVYYAGFKNHCSLYPITAAIRRAHAEALDRYETSTGTVRFPLSRPVPLGLVKRLVKARRAEVKARRK